jgi:hypothetical protein
MLIAYLITITILVFTGIDWAIKFFISQTSNIIMSILGYPTVILFVKNNIICYKKDAAKNGIALLLFNIFYNPFYFMKVLKNNWL